jgi:hypothetical protein
VEYHTVGTSPVVKGVFGEFDQTSPDADRQHLDNRANIARPVHTGDRHPDDLFRDLDGRQIARASGVWLVFVSAIHSVGARRWIQVALSGTPSYTLILKASDRVEGSEALAAIGAWLTSPLRDDRVITID